MVQERLVKYILRYVEKGFSLQRIAKRLMNDGWDETEIQEAAKVVQENMSYNKPSSKGQSNKAFKESEVKNSKKKSGKSSSKSKGISAAWKMRLVIILGIVVLLGVGILAAFLIFG